MRNKLKSIIAGTLAATLCAGLLVGCGSKASTSSSSAATTSEVTGKADVTFKSDKALEFSMLFNDSPTYPYQQDWLLFQQIKKIANVNLKLTVVPMSDYIQKRSLLISTGDAPEIMPKTYPGQEVQFIASGAILPISDYVNKMPNYMKKIKDWNMESDLKTLQQKDGKYYVLPGLHQTALQDYSIIVRTDIFEKNNIAIPTTYDELKQALAKLKTAYPNIIPWSDKVKFESALNVAAPTFGTTWGWNTGNGMMYNKAKDQFTFAPVTDEYKSMLTYFNGLVKDKLLDPESFTQSDDQAMQKFVNGKSFVISGNSQDVILYRNAMNGTLGADKFKIIKITDPAGPKGSVVSGTRLENGIMFSAKAAKDPNFDKMLQFVDWLWYSDEGQTLTKWGVKDTTYKVVDGKKVLADDINFQGLNPKGTKDLRKQFGFSSGVFSYGGNDDLVQSMMNSEDVAFQKSIKSTKTLLPPDPPVLFSDDERDQSTLISKPLMDYVKQMTLKFIIGNSNLDSDWSSFVSTSKTKGSDKLIDLTNKVYKSTKSSSK